MPVDVPAPAPEEVPEPGIFCPNVTLYGRRGPEPPPTVNQDPDELRADQPVPDPVLSKTVGDQDGFMA